MFTFTVTSDGYEYLGIEYEQWPGGSETLSVPGDSACSVTVTEPSGDISTLGGTGGVTGWSITSNTGFTSVSGTVKDPSCNSVASLVSGLYDSYPSCTVDYANGSASTDDFVVTAS